MAQAADTSASEFEAQVLARSEIARVRIALDELPDAQRVVLVLWMTEDLSYDQIAAQMNVSESSVKSLLFRARANLEKKIRGAG